MDVTETLENNMCFASYFVEAPFGEMPQLGMNQVQPVQGFARSKEILALLLAHSGAENAAPHDANPVSQVRDRTQQDFGKFAMKGLDSC